MNPMQNMPIAVLAGGTSCEREISLISGKAVFEALRSLGLRVTFVDAVGDFMSPLKESGAAIVFIALHGTFGEDGTVQRLLEREGLIYTGPGPVASQLAFDKEASQNLFLKAGVRVPAFQVFHDIPAALKKVPEFFPKVVKPTKSGSSVGVSILKDASGYESAVREAFLFSDSIMVDDYISGRELTVGFLGEETLPVVEVIVSREFYDYKAKYQDQKTRYEFPAKLSELERSAVTQEALKATQVLGTEVMSRVDLILDLSGRPWVLEVNTIPGLTPKSLLPKAAQAAGIPFSELCVRILELSMAKTKAVP